MFLINKKACIGVVAMNFGGASFSTFPAAGKHTLNGRIKHIIDAPYYYFYGTTKEAGCFFTGVKLQKPTVKNA